MKAEAPGNKYLNTDIVWGLLLGAAASLLLLVTYWPEPPGGGEDINGFGWPRVILLSLLATSLLLAVLGWRRGPDTGTAAEAIRMPICVALICAAYLLGLYYAGFMVSTFVFAATLPRVLGRPLHEATLYSIGLTSVAWLFLIKLLSVPLPKGMGIFHAVSVWFV